MRHLLLIGSTILALPLAALPSANAVPQFGASTAAPSVHAATTDTIQIARGGERGGAHAGAVDRGNVGRNANVNRNANANRNLNQNINRNANRNVNRKANINRNANLNRNTNVNRNVNRNANINRTTVGVGNGGWTRPANYWWRPGGAIAAGAAIGFVGAAAASSWAGAPPADGYCWYYTDESRQQGFWDQCP